MKDFRPAYTEKWTPFQIQEELGIEFVGPGWYNILGDTALIVPLVFENWAPIWTPDSKFLVHVFNQPNAQNVFADYFKAPVRK